MRAISGHVTRAVEGAVDVALLLLLAFSLALSLYVSKSAALFVRSFRSMIYG